MKIKNLTSEVVDFKVSELSGERDFFISLLGNGSTEILGAYIPNIEKYKGILEVESPFSSIETLKDFEEREEEISEEVPETLAEEVEEIPEDIEEPQGDLKDVFICDICEAEFASMRGLTSHKSRVHP